MVSCFQANSFIHVYLLLRPGNGRGEKNRRGLKGNVLKKSGDARRKKKPVKEKPVKQLKEKLPLPVESRRKLFPLAWNQKKDLMSLR